MSVLSFENNAGSTRIRWSSTSKKMLMPRRIEFVLNPLLALRGAAMLIAGGVVLAGSGVFHF